MAGCISTCLRFLLTSTVPNNIVNVTSANSIVVANLGQSVITLAVKLSNFFNLFIRQLCIGAVFTAQVLIAFWLSSSPRSISTSRFLWVSSRVMAVSAWWVKQAFSARVYLIISICSEEKMLRVYASWIIAFMTNVHAAGVAFRYRVGKAMRGYHASPDFYKSIAATGFDTLPDPASLFGFCFYASLKTGKLIGRQVRNWVIFNVSHFILRFRLIWLGLLRYSHDLSGPFTNCSTSMKWRTV